MPSYNTLGQKKAMYVKFGEKKPQWQFFGNKFQMPSLVKNKSDDERKKPSILKSI
jgi:hypothetical protein